jgi:hypothetical protein
VGSLNPMSALVFLVIAVHDSEDLPTGEHHPLQE